MSSTNWKNLGRKQGGNMKNYRNVKSDKNFYNNGKWGTVYSDDDIKRLAYYNIDLPHVVGIGTNTPFSKLSFGDSSQSGYHPESLGNIETSTGLTPGKLSSIALNEVTRTEEGQPKRRGQEFNGLGYVTNLRSVRDINQNTDAKGIGIFSNKFSPDEDTSQKTDKAIMYITDDKHVQIGGIPTGYNLVDRRGQNNINNRSFNRNTQETGPNIIIDISGSMHVNGFINFLKSGNTGGAPTQQQDNPANQLTFNNATNQIEYADSDNKTAIDNRAIPEGAIFVGWDKEESSSTLISRPRLYIMLNGEQKRIATEDDKDFYINENDSGITFTASGVEVGGERFYIFRNNEDTPSTTIMNTYSGGSTTNFNGSSGSQNNVPRTNDVLATAKSNSLQVIGNLSVFDYTSGGTSGEKLDISNWTHCKQILVSEIYQTSDNILDQPTPGKELGTIYTDRHLMIGGLQGGRPGKDFKKTFSHFGSAIDISGGTIGKPAIRVITGAGTQGNTGTIVSSNPRDSIIIGNTHPIKFITKNAECILVGENDRYENNENTLVMGNNNTVKNTKNSIVIGEGCKVDVSSNVISGLVVMGADTEANQSSDRIVFGTSTKKRAFVIDENGQVTIAGDLKVQGGHVHMETERIVGADEQVDINSKYDENSNSVVGNATYGPNAANGGIQLFLTENNPSDNAQFTFDNFNKRWTTANSSYSIGFAAAANTVGTSGTERFKVTKDGDLEISSDGTSANDKFKVTAQDGHVDMSGNLHIHGTGGITLENGETITNTNDGTVVINGEVAAGLGDSGSSVFKSNGAYDVTLKPGGTNSSNIKIEGTNNTGDITITASKDIVMNATDDIVMDASGDIVMKPTSTTSKMVIYEEYDSANVKGAEFVKNGISNAVDLKISGKLDVLGLIDPTGLILSNHNLTSAEINAMDTESLAIYNDGTGKLSFKFKDTNGSMATHELATIGGGQQISGNISNATLANFAHDLSFNSANFGKGILYQDTVKETKIKQYETANTTNFLKADGTYAVPPGTFSLSIASNNLLGGVMGGGSNISIDATGVISSTNTQLSNSAVQAIVGNMVSQNTESGISVTYASSKLNFAVNDSLDLSGNGDKYIQILQPTDADDGKNLTIEAGSAKNNNSNPTADRDGGDLVLKPGQGTGNGTVGSIQMMNIPGAPPNEQATNPELLVIDFAGKITAGASDINLDNDADRTITINESDAGRNLLIKAGNADNNGNPGGTLLLSGGDGDGAGASGVVEITSGFKLSNSSYTSSNGPLHVTSGVVGVGTTDNVPEGTNNLYFTNARADARITSADTDDLSEGSSNLYFTNARADARISAADTDDLSEGSSNLYFTNARADARITNALIDEDDMSSNSATKLPSQQSVKAYVDAHPGIVSSSGSSSISGISSKYRLINPQFPGQYVDNTGNTVSLPGYTYRNITSSADGTKLVMSTADGDIWYSSDSGAIWTETAIQHHTSAGVVCVAPQMAQN